MPPKPMEDVRSITFRNEVLLIGKNGRPPKLKVDADGYYKDVPAAVLGVVTDNNTYYPVQSVLDQVLPGKPSFLNRLLQRKQLYGEWAHPNISHCRSDREIIERMSTISEAFTSHHIRSVHTGPMLEGGGRLLCVDLKPTGEKGDVMRRSLDDTAINTALSLRSLTSEKTIDGVSHRTVRKLMTFDGVNAGGYYGASKEFSPSLESLRDVGVSVTLAKGEGRNVLTTVALEKYTDHELNEIFGTQQVAVLGHEYTIVTGSSKSLLDRKTGELMTAAQLMLRR